MTFPSKPSGRRAWLQRCGGLGLQQSGRWLPTLVLGIWNREHHRNAEYFPEKALAFIGAGGESA